MKNFRLLTKTRQITEYSCGASAVQAVLSYWGRDVDETELMKLLQTSSEVGTYPEDIVRGVRSLGFAAEVRENLTLEEVERFTADGSPMIALAQVWRSQRDTPPSAEEEWDCGHYVVVLGVDSEYVYFQDPYLRMGKAFVPRKTFEQHWHQVMGGDLEGKPKLVHLGIFIRGETPAPASALPTRDVAQLDFRKLGSLNLMITEFPGVLLPFDFMDELRDLWASGSVRPDAIIIVRKDKDGKVSGMEGGRLDEGADASEINALIAMIASRSVGRPELSLSKAESALQSTAAGDFGLSPAEIRRIGQKLASGHSAIIVLFENVWERRFREIAKNHAGTVTAQRLISPEGLVKAFTDLIAEATD